MRDRFGLIAILAGASFSLSTTVLLAQDMPSDRPLGPRRGQREITVLQSPLIQSTSGSAPRGFARYSAKDWRRLIDSTWGPGLPTDQKLAIFDGFWTNVDQHYGGFPNLPVNWDSLKSVYRPEIVQGVSRGRFAGIMSHLYLSLREGHTLIVDWGIDSAIYGTGQWLPRGVPVLYLSGYDWTGMGATLTPLPDSSLLVIQVAPNQPLGLQAGDVVLGYDGVPWKQLILQLLDAQLPVGFGSLWGTSPESWWHNLLTAAAANWPLFDTLDVVKYATGETVHLPTWKLEGDWDTWYAVEQLPIQGVPSGFNASNGPWCAWGVVEGTNVGYVYIRNWYGDTPQLVDSAVTQLTRVRKTDGLIIDFRLNLGGTTLALPALGVLFNNNPLSWFSVANRASTTDRMAFTIAPYGRGVIPNPQYYDRPIAVLTGPVCGSIGDWGAFMMRSHPMVRFFGKPTETAYLAGTSLEGDYSSGLWYYYIAGGDVYSNYPNEGHMFHRGFDVDERVWFTKDDAARGDDTVVKRALAWINNLAYAHDVKATPFVRPNLDTIWISAVVKNPLAHAISLWAIIADSSGHTTDSIAFANDGLHNDGTAGDSIWGAFASPRATSGKSSVTVATSDLVQGSVRRLSNAASLVSTAATFDQGILLVNGIDFSAYADEVPTAYQDRAYSGAYPIVFWDCFPTPPANGYPSALPAPLGHGPVPQEILAKYSTVIWIGNAYNGDLLPWGNTQILWYLRAGGNVILLAKNGSSFTDFLLTDYLGISWAELASALTNSTAAYTGLTALRTLGAQNQADLFTTSLMNSESQLLFTSTGSFGTRGIGVWKKPASGGTSKAKGGQFVFISGRPYRWNHSDLKASMEYILKNFMGETMPTSVENGSAVPLTFDLSQSYPNPFNPTTTIRYALPRRAHVTLTVYNTLGQRVAVLVNGDKSTGTYEVQFNAVNLASGMYFYRLQVGSYVQTRSLCVLR